MARKALSGPTIWIEDTINLNAVTVATTGDTIDMRWYKRKAVYVNVTGNTGAVTVTIQASHDGITWMDLNTKTYSASNEYDVFHYVNHYPYMRVKTTSQTTSTVSAIITGRS